MVAQSFYSLIIACLLAYLLASIPFGLLLVKLAGKGDVRQTGSGNIGATNVMRAGGKALGIFTLLLDAAKGYLPVHLALRFGWTPEGASMIALAGVLGHIYTPWLKFQGGKGVATALGAVLGYHPAMALPSLACFILLLAIFRYVSLASILSVLMVIPSVTGLFGGWACLLFADPAMVKYGVMAWVILALLVVLRHSTNIRRLIQGTENQFGKGRQERSNA